MPHLYEDIELRKQRLAMPDFVSPVDAAIYAGVPSTTIAVWTMRGRCLALRSYTFPHSLVYPDWQFISRVWSTLDVVRAHLNITKDDEDAWRLMSFYESPSSLYDGLPPLAALLSGRPLQLSRSHHGR